MKREELLALLQEKGLSDDEIKALLKETLDTLDKDFYDADKKEEIEEKHEDEKEDEKLREVFGI